ncbi:MAG: hypothetical protein ACP5IL_15420, partial [Syntrophobacteraceae bacterium]
HEAFPEIGQKNSLQHCLQFRLTDSGLSLKIVSTFKPLIENIKSNNVIVNGELWKSKRLRFSLR